MTDPLQILFIGLGILGVVVGGGALVVYKFYKAISRKE
jgi:hypothetical protein